MRTRERPGVRGPADRFPGCLSRSFPTSMRVAGRSPVYIAGGCADEVSLGAHGQSGRDRSMGHRYRAGWQEPS